MRILNEFCVREVMDEVVAILTGEAAKKFYGIISLDPVSRFLFEKLQQEQTVQSLVDAVLEEYEVDPQTAQQDVESFLDQLRQHQLLVEEA